MKNLTLFFGFVLVAMLCVTSWATLQQPLFVGGGQLLREPWGIATLFDTYFGFLTFYVWVLYKERDILSRVVWFILIMCLGNIAMAIYVLLQIKKAKTNTFEGVLLRG